MSFQPIRLPVGTSPIPGVIPSKDISTQSSSVTPTPDIPEGLSRDVLLSDTKVEYGPIDNRAFIDPVLESLSPSTGLKTHSFPTELNFQDSLSRIPFVEITAYDVSSDGFESRYNSINSSENDIGVNSLGQGDQTIIDRFVTSYNVARENVSNGLTILRENTKLRDKKLTPLVKMRLPAPPNLESNYSLKYTDNEGVGSARRAAEIVNTSLNNNNIGVPNYILKQGSAAIISNIVSAVVQKTGGVGNTVLAGDPNFNDYIKFQSRSIPTPMIEYTFEGIDRRKFNFTWKMYAKSSKEAAEIYNIILNLKKYAHPSALIHNSESNDTSSVDKFYIRYPKVFTLKHLYLREDNTIVENLYINRIKPCVVTSIRVNYTDSNSLVLFNKAIENLGSDENYRAPIGVELSISMTELELLMSEDFFVNSKATNLFTEGGY